MVTAHTEEIKFDIVFRHKKSYNKSIFGQTEIIMDIKDKLKNHWRRMALMDGILTISASSLNAQTQNRQQDKDYAPKAYFSPKQLASSLANADINDERTASFIEAYMAQLDSQGKISPEGMMKAFKEAGFSIDEAKKISNSLMGKDDKNSPKGYGSENYDMIFSINEKGDLTHLTMNGERQYSDKDIDEIHHARCRHLGIAVDDNKNRFEASNLIAKMMVRDVILERQGTDKAVQNGDKFLKNFDKELAKDGLEIGKDGKLHGIEASKNKPLLTEKDLFNQYVQKRQMEMKNFRY